MARKSDSGFRIYSFDIELTLRRDKPDSSYYSDTLATVDIKRTIPLPHDEAAKQQLRELVMEELDRAVGVVEARVKFENRVKQLTGGDVIDADSEDDD